MQRYAVLAYGILVYVFFLWTITYAIGFVTGIGVPASLDSLEPSAGWHAWAINIGILILFAVQHTVMARQGFKKRWTQIIPAAAERSTFVLVTCCILNLLFFQWRGLGGEIWTVEGDVAVMVLKGVSLFGWLLVFVTTFLIDHFHLFGLKQVWRNFKQEDSAPKRFMTPWLYRHSRHPMYVGFFIAFWATPTMSTGHLLFALMTTGYVIFEVVFFEEPDLVTEFGDQYRWYQRAVPMFLPRSSKKSDSETRLETMV